MNTKGVPTIKSNIQKTTTATQKTNKMKNYIDVKTCLYLSLGRSDTPISFLNSNPGLKADLKAEIEKKQVNNSIKYVMFMFLCSLSVCLSDCKQICAKLTWLIFMKLGRVKHGPKEEPITFSSTSESQGGSMKFISIVWRGKILRLALAEVYAQQCTPFKNPTDGSKV